MSREVQKVFCQCCESEYKILYDVESASGLPKFCSFCSAELFEPEPKEDEEDGMD